MVDLPAISTAPKRARNPLGAHIQWAGRQYTTVFTRENKQYALKFALSAIAPDTIVVAVVANDN